MRSFDQRGTSKDIRKTTKRSAGYVRGRRRHQVETTTTTTTATRTGWTTTAAPTIRPPPQLRSRGKPTELTSPVRSVERASVESTRKLAGRCWTTTTRTGRTTTAPPTIRSPPPPSKSRKAAGAHKPGKAGKDDDGDESPLEYDEISKLWKPAAGKVKAKPDRKNGGGAAEA